MELPIMILVLCPNLFTEAPTIGLGNPTQTKNIESTAATVALLHPNSADMIGKNAPKDQKNVPALQKNTNTVPSRAIQLWGPSIVLEEVIRFIVISTYLSCHRLVFNTILREKH